MLIAMLVPEKPCFVITESAHVFLDRRQETNPVMIFLRQIDGFATRNAGFKVLSDRQDSSGQTSNAPAGFVNEFDFDNQVDDLDFKAHDVFSSSPTQPRTFHGAPQSATAVS